MALILRPSGFATTGPLLLTRQFWGSDTAIWVDSTRGSDSNTGQRRELPKATVFGASGAISVCTSGVSNVVICEAAHRETLGGAYAWSTSGVTLVSLGSGSARARVLSGGYTITVSAADVRLQNLYFSASTATCTSRITVTGTGFLMRDCYLESASYDTTDGVLISAATNAYITGTTFKSSATPTGSAQRGLRITGASTGARCWDCTFDGTTVGWTDAGFKIDDALADKFDVQGLSLQNYTIAKISVSGTKGLLSLASCDNTSRVEWAE